MCGSFQDTLVQTNKLTNKLTNMVKITNLIDSRMNNIEVVTLMTGMSRIGK